MYIVKDNKAIRENIFDGRNSEWFGNLQGEGWDDEYNHFPRKFGFSSQAPEDLIHRYEKRDGYYGFYYVNVQEFKDWFQRYRPDKKAGWCTTYDKWRIENKGFIPDELQYKLHAEDIIEDMHFIEYTNLYDCSAWLFTYLVENEIDNDADITYFFDH